MSRLGTAVCVVAGTAALLASSAEMGDGPRQEPEEAVRQLSADECMALTGLGVELLSWQPGPEPELVDRYVDEFEAAAAQTDYENPPDVSKFVDEAEAWVKQRRANRAAQNLLWNLREKAEEAPNGHCDWNYLGTFNTPSSGSGRV